MKRVLSAAAALTLTLSLGASALAYSGTITINGTALSTAGIPDAPAGSVIPLRAVAEADTALPTGMPTRTGPSSPWTATESMWTAPPEPLSSTARP